MIIIDGCEVARTIASAKIDEGVGQRSTRTFVNVCEQVILIRRGKSLRQHLLTTKLPDVYFSKRNNLANLKKLPRCGVEWGGS